MIITKTPFRMSFFGGGTDLADFFREYGGAVISTTINKYCYVTVRRAPPSFDTTDDLPRPMIREALNYLDMRGASVVREADIPAGTGLGTSSAFAVGLLNALYALKGQRPDKRKLADEAIYLERVLCHEAGGWQDQIAASYGGLNRIDFSADGYQVTPIVLSPSRKKALNQNLMLFFTGVTRPSARIHADIQKRLRDKTETLLEIKRLTDTAYAVLTDESVSLDAFGELLGRAWNLKKRIGDGISASAIDEWYDKAMQAGALGGKLLGAGGGGFLLFYVPRERREEALERLSDLTLTPFEFEDTGAEILRHAPEYA